MHDDVQIYDHPVLSPRARRLLLVVAAVAALVLGLVAPAQAADGHVTGTVTGEGAGALADIWVDVYDIDDLAYVDSDLTDASGHYDVTVPAGSYLVIFYSNDESYEAELYDDVHDFDFGAATPVVVPSSGSAVANAELTPTASIAGHLTLHAGDPADSVQVYDDQNHVVGRGFVDTDGSYRVTGLGAGSYRLAFNRLSGFAYSAAEFYDDHPEGAGLAGGDAVSLTTGEQRTGVDAVLVEGGHITGTLLDSDGHPLQCRLQAFTTDRSMVTRSGRSDAVTGAFDITGLSTGSYLVRVVNGSGCQNDMQYVDGTGGPLTPTAGAADPVAATLGGTTALSPTLVYDLGPTPVNTAPPSVSGSPTVGATLTAHHGTWSPASHLSYHYQWLAAGVAVPGATHSTYHATTADLGKTLAVTVTVTRGPRTAHVTSAPTTPVTAAAATALFALSAPRVSGTAAVDSTLTVSPGTWSVPGATFSYVWTSGSRLVAQTASPTLKVPESVFKQPLALTVVASRAGYANGQATVPVTTKVMAGTWAAIPDPRIKGKARVGSMLKVRVAQVSPKPRLSFQWYRDGRAIATAHGKRYELTAADAGHRIHVVVRYGRLHYDHADVASKPTPRVRG